MDRLKTIVIHFNITGGDLRLKNVGFQLVHFVLFIAQQKLLALLVRWYIEMFWEMSIWPKIVIKHARIFFYYLK